LMGKKKKLSKEELRGILDKIEDEMTEISLKIFRAKLKRALQAYDIENFDQFMFTIDIELQSIGKKKKAQEDIMFR